MRDEIDSRIWAEHGHGFATDLDRFFATARDAIGTALERLNQIQFDAPWKHDAQGPGHA